MEYFLIYQDRSGWWCIQCHIGLVKNNNIHYDDHVQCVFKVIYNRALQ